MGYCLVLKRVADDALTVYFSYLPVYSYLSSYMVKFYC